MSQTNIQGVGVISTPSTFIPPINLLIEIIGETGVGKSHLASKAPKPFLIDTSAKGEARTTFLRVNGLNYIDRYAHVNDWISLESKIKEACERLDVLTVIIDNSSDLQDLARDKYLSSSSKQRVSALQIEYGKIRDLVDLATFKITAMPPTGAGKNLIMTSNMKDKWKTVLTASGDTKAMQDGRMRDGFARLDFQSDIRLHVQLLEVCSWCKKTTFGGTCTCGKMPLSTKLERFVTVVKNRFLDRISPDWISSIDANWEGIKKLVKLGEGEKILE